MSVVAFVFVPDQSWTSSTVFLDLHHLGSVEVNPSRGISSSICENCLLAEYIFLSL